MRSTLISSKIPKHQINIRAKKTQIKTYAAAFDWLHDLKLSDEYNNYVAARRLLPEKTWKMYETLQLEGLAEIKILNATGSALRKRWRKSRPVIFNKEPSSEIH